MHTADRLEQAIRQARERGFGVRLEALCGTSGGLCEFGQKRWIFVDLSLTVAEQLDQVVSAMQIGEKNSRQSRATNEAA